MLIYEILAVRFVLRIMDEQSVRLKQVTNGSHFNENDIMEL